MKFELHNLDTAPGESQPLLENSLKAFGMIPGLHSVLAESPQTLEILLGLSQKLMSNYANHLAETPIDEPFKKFIWQS